MDTICTSHTWVAWSKYPEKYLQKYESWLQKRGDAISDFKEKLVRGQ